MAQFKDKYHKAARDGYLDILREASRKDCDTRDEDGMTPVMWSAFYGRIDALRLLMSRGGNTDLTDFLGNTALHHAAANGHLPCCSFLVNFGANIWALDNDLHSALDIAVLRNQRDVIDFLDSVVGQQRAMNTRMTTKLHQRAVSAAEKRRKEYEKMQTKARRRLEKEENMRVKQRQKMTYGHPSEMTSDIMTVPSKSNNPFDGNQSTTIRSLRSPKYPDSFQFSDENSHNHHGTSGFGGHSISSAGVAKRVGKKKNDHDFIVTEQIAGKKSVRSLTGLKRDSEILYTTSGDPKTLSAMSNPDIYWNSSGGEMKTEAGLFERPGFGSVAFLSRPNVSDALMSLPGTADIGNGYTDQDNPNNGGEMYNDNIGELRRSHNYNDNASIGTAGSLMKRMSNLPWSEDEVENLDDDLATNTLELFLACHSLTECASMLTKEKIDLNALLLCDDEDLKKIGLHLGPRKKILDAIEKRKSVMATPGHMFDSYL